MRTTNRPWRILPATTAHARGIAACHIASWREAYRGLVPAPILDAFDVDRRAAAVTRDLRDDRSGRTRVALVGDDVIGFATAAHGELRALYVRAGWYGTGVADDLLVAVLDPGVATSLWVFEDNPRARAFYRRHGFTASGERGPEAFTALPQVRMVRPAAKVPSMTSTEQTEYITTADGVLQITIATAANGTALDFAGIAAGTTALRERGAEVGAVLLTGTGANFCAGGNVRGFAAAEDRGAHIHGLATDLHEFVRALDATTVPVVAGVQGWAAGAGMSLVLAADIALGGPSTKLRPAYPGIGLSPDGGMSWTLPRVVGMGRAREILLTDAVLDADEAVRLGILSRLVADDAVREAARELAVTLARGPRTTYAGMKELLRASLTSSLSDQLDRERDGIAAAANSPAGREGVDAFVQKRPPRF
ncbi:enoyl-CoA hydratase [Nocardia farcinica]|nr:enoyl-CoA hydratase [Nocardia farcinica]